MSPSRAVAAGQVVVVWMACQSVGSGVDPADTNYNQRMSCNDDAGNVYCTIGARTGAEGAGAAMGAIFVAQLKNALTTSSVITVQIRVSPGVPCAISVEEFTPAGGTRFAACTTVTGAVNNTDPPAITISSLAASREYLFLHLLSWRGPSTDSFTWDADYTQITTSGTTGGADDTNITCLGGYRVATLTGDTVDVTSDTHDYDNVQVFNAITEVVSYPSFPQTAVLDDFNRADQDPLDGTDWVSAACCCGTAGLRFNRILSNQAAMSGAGISGSWRSTVPNCDNFEVYLSTPVAGDLMAICAGQGCTNSGNAQGIAARWETVAIPLVRQDIRACLIGNSGSGTGTRLRLWVDRANGNKLGIQRVSEATHWWVDRGSGWLEAGAYLNYESPWNGFGGSGKLGFAMYDGTVRADDFGGGCIPAPDLHLLPILHVGT